MAIPLKALIDTSFCHRFQQSNLCIQQNRSPPLGPSQQAGGFRFWNSTVPDLAGADTKFSHRKLPPRNGSASTKLTPENSESRQSTQALKIYVQMRAAGMRPSTYTFVAALKACGRVGDLQTAKKIHAHVIESGVELQIFVANTLVDMYAKCGSMDDAQEVFDRMPDRNLVSWNALILGYAHMGEGDLALRLFAQMQRGGFGWDARSFVGALKACGCLAEDEDGEEINGKVVKSECLQKGRSIHHQISSSGFDSDVFVATTLVDMYAKCGSMEDARRVFDRMMDRNVVAWSAMILGYAESKEGEVSLQLYARMHHEGITPNARTFVGALKACASLAAEEEAKGNHLKSQSLEKGRCIHSQAAKSGFDSDIFVANTLVDMYAKCGSMEDARRVFEKMPHRDVVSWNSLILGYAQREEGEVALQLYAHMQHEGLTPDSRTFVGALKACGSRAALEIGKQIHVDICRAGMEDDAIVANVLLDMYCKCGSMGDAQNLFDALQRRDLVTWSALIAGYSRQGDSDSVFNLFQKMHQDGIQPNGITFLSVLTVCSHVGLVHEGWKIFKAMTADYRITPTIDHFSCMVDLLGRAGQLDEAVSVVKMMPFEPDMATWRTILAACQKWNAVEIGRHAFDCVVKLDCSHAASYVLMSNIYEAAGMCEESRQIDAMRRNVGPL